MSFLADFEQQITEAFAEVVTPTTASVVSQFQPIFVAGFSIWILLIAYDVAWGRTEDSLLFLITKIGKVFLTGTVALWGWPMLQETATGVRDTFVVAVTCTTGGICGTTVSSLLETHLLDPLSSAWANLWSQVLTAFSPTDFIGFGWINTLFLILLTLVVYGVLSLFVGLLAVITLAMYLVALATFSLLLCVGPFFLMCVAFPVVQRFFESWVGSVITASLGMAFTALLAIMTATFLGLDELVPLTAIADLDTYALMLAFAGKSGLCLLLIYLYYKVFDLAAALGGGLNLGNNMAGAMRQIARDVVRPARSRTGGGGQAVNTLSEGRRTGRGPAHTAPSRLRPSLSESLGARQTFTGMAVAAGAHLTGAALRFAYNRGASIWRSRS